MLALIGTIFLVMVGLAGVIYSLVLLKCWSLFNDKWCLIIGLILLVLSCTGIYTTFKNSNITLTIDSHVQVN